MDKTLLVSAIKKGTVIDHIVKGQAIKIIKLLNLASHDKRVTLGLNLPSKTQHHKDLIKVEGRELTPAEANSVAILTPQATINIIDDYRVVKKFTCKLPEKIKHIIVCPNPQCITNHEEMDTNFQVNQEKKQVKLQCHYCEKKFNQDEITSYNT
ncbi:aspartate carbamoyltransferase regulatory subunit [Patescibacteria group bacterium]|nr:aspartate carbamoyltransferase regulatory subunit [Patescibacteria group bacterium]MBU1895632.1 aspartate carbamoyltransferase regulatory subunit [Patescibacteria group bacterium]